LFGEDEVGLEEAVSELRLADVDDRGDELGHLGLGEVEHVLHDHLVYQLHKVAQTPAIPVL